VAHNAADHLGVAEVEHLFVVLAQNLFSFSNVHISFSCFDFSVTRLGGAEWHIRFP